MSEHDPDPLVRYPDRNHPVQWRFMGNVMGWLTREAVALRRERYALNRTRYNGGALESEFSSYIDHGGLAEGERAE